MIPSDFYPRPPRGGRPRLPRPCGRRSRHFYPRPPRGGRLLADFKVWPLFPFLSTPSARRATKEAWPHSKSTIDFYPRPPRGGRLSRFLRGRHCAGISIHALREEGDRASETSGLKTTKFLSTPSARRATCHADNCCLVYAISIHALREEGDSKNRDKISIFL